MSTLGFVVSLTLLASLVSGAPNVRDDALIMGQDREESLDSCKTSQDYQNLSSFEFNPRSVPIEDTSCLSFKMFEEMRLIQQFHIPTNKLSRFIRQAQKGYNNVPYHNWEHGFAVLHFTFAVLKNCKKVENYCFTPLESLALLTAAMCHDMDHPGTNSQFQMETNSVIAQAYQEQGSILERYHIEKTFNLLSHPEANFLGQLPENDSKHFMRLVGDIILATDLTTHFKVFPAQKKMANVGFDVNNQEHHHLLLSLVISSADLSDQTKDWDSAKKSAKLVITEFFHQGDKEKEMGLTPIKIMDREKVNIAEEQANFISRVVMPLFRVLTQMCSEVQVCIQNLENNLNYWQKSIPYFKEQSKMGQDQLKILDDFKISQSVKKTEED